MYQSTVHVCLSTLAIHACYVYLLAAADSAQCSYYEQDDFIFPLNACVNSSVADHSASSALFYCHVGLLGRPNVYKRVYSQTSCSGSYYDTHLGYCTSPQCNCGDSSSSSSSSSSSCNTETFYYDNALCDSSEIAEHNITVIVNECVDGKMLVTKSGSNYLHAVHYGDESCATSKPLTVQRQCYSLLYTAPADTDVDTDTDSIYIDPDTETEPEWQGKTTSKAPPVPSPNDDGDASSMVHMHMGAIYGAILGLALWGIGCCLCCLLQRCCKKGGKGRRQQIANADARKLIDNDIELNKEGVKSESRECDEVQEIIIPGVVVPGQCVPNDQMNAAEFRSIVDDILVKYDVQGDAQNEDTDESDNVADDVDIPAAAYSDFKHPASDAHEREEIEISEDNEGEGIVDAEHDAEDVDAYVDVDAAHDEQVNDEQDPNADSHEIKEDANDENDK